MEAFPVIGPKLQLSARARLALRAGNAAPLHSAQRRQDASSVADFELAGRFD
jgi:hypothetical protein